MHNPKLLIFDEPFSGFDPVNANLLKQEILEMRDKGATIIFSTHNMGSVEELCDEISLINRSHVVLQGEINNIREQHKKHLFKIEVQQGNLQSNYMKYWRQKNDTPILHIHCANEMPKWATTNSSPCSRNNASYRDLKRFCPPWTKFLLKPWENRLLKKIQTSSKSENYE